MIIFMHGETLFMDFVFITNTHTHTYSLASAHHFIAQNIFFFEPFCRRLSHFHRSIRFGKYFMMYFLALVFFLSFQFLSISYIFILLSACFHSFLALSVRDTTANENCCAHWKENKPMYCSEAVSLFSISFSFLGCRHFQKIKPTIFNGEYECECGVLVLLFFLVLRTSSLTLCMVLYGCWP